MLTIPIWLFNPNPHEECSPSAHSIKRIQCLITFPNEYQPWMLISTQVISYDIQAFHRIKLCKLLNQHYIWTVHALLISHLPSTLLITSIHISMESVSAKLHNKIINFIFSLRTYLRVHPGALGSISPLDCAEAPSKLSAGGLILLHPRRRGAHWVMEGLHRDVTIINLLQHR